jgi:osmotically-inducible protein OsmY
MTSSGYGGPETERDYRGGGYGSAYMPGGYDPDNDYRGRMTGSGGDRRGLGASQSDWAKGPASGRRSGATGFGEHRGRGPKGYARSDDRVREDVCDRLTDDPRLDASEIEVAVSNGEVTLSGTVGDRGARRYAEELAERIGGVRHVQNNLRFSQAGTAVGLGSAPGMAGLG